MRGQSNAAKPPFSAQTGWSVRRKSSILAVLTTPSAPLEEASRHFIYVASTPPLRGGESGLRQFIHTFADRAYSSHQAKNLAALGFSPRLHFASWVS
jgi:hypothetical protein